MLSYYRLTRTMTKARLVCTYFDTLSMPSPNMASQFYINFLTFKKKKKNTSFCRQSTSSQNVLNLYAVYKRRLTQVKFIFSVDTKNQWADMTLPHISSSSAYWFGLFFKWKTTLNILRILIMLPWKAGFSLIHQTNE